MLRRFVSATAVVGTLMGFGAVGLYVVAHQMDLPKPYLLALLWCVLPVTWGVWALLIPKRWAPQRLPWWGAILGLMVGVMGAFVLDVPGRVAGFEPSAAWRGLGVVLAAIVYYLLWMVVRLVYRGLQGPEPKMREVRAAA